MPRLVSTAKTPETAMAWPACPSVTCRSAAIGVSRLTGMNSEAISVATQRERANTAPQPAALDSRDARAGAATSSVACIRDAPCFVVGETYRVHLNQPYRGVSIYLTVLHAAVSITT